MFASAFYAKRASHWTLFFLLKQLFINNYFCVSKVDYFCVSSLLSVRILLLHEVYCEAADLVLIRLPP